MATGPLQERVAEDGKAGEPKWASSSGPCQLGHSFLIASCLTTRWLEIPTFRS